MAERISEARQPQAAVEQLNFTIWNGFPAGARLADQIGIKSSGDTILRVLQRARPTQILRPNTILGADRWTWCKGQRYGTILVDLERRRPIALLCRQCRARFPNTPDPNASRAPSTGFAILERLKALAFIAITVQFVVAMVESYIIVAAGSSYLDSESPQRRGCPH
jgi:hypothetical protein